MDNTIIVVTADHGDMLGERGLWYKMNFFEHSARVPLVMAGPGIAKGTAGNAVSLIDLLPTFIEIAGGDDSILGEPIDGRSLMPLARGEDDPVDEAIGEYCAEMTAHPVIMIRRGALKYIHCDSDPPMMFDVLADPHEMTNLVGDPRHAQAASDFAREIEDRWDGAAMRARIIATQKSPPRVACGDGSWRQRKLGLQPTLGCKPALCQKPHGLDRCGQPVPISTAEGRQRMMLDGKIALVTGARGGIGRAIVARFLKEGATVYAADLSPQGSLDGTDAGGQFIKLDVTREEDAITAMAQVADAHGKLDVLVNAAGIEIEKTIEDTTLDEWNRSFAVNVTGTFLTSKHALPLMRNAAASGGSASLINFGSYDGFIADPGLAAYCATKGAVHALTRAMACDHGPEGIRVNAICPGYVDTPMLQSFFNGDGSGAGGGNIETLQKAVRDVHPMRTYGTPEDIANLVNWLASDEARYASGQLWILDGGLSAQVQQMKL